MTRRSLFQSELIQLGDVCVQPRTGGFTNPEAMDHNAIAMPLRGVFASHFSRRRVLVTTPNDAVLLGAGVPHHYSFPGGIGDHSLVMRWSSGTLAKFHPGLLDRDRFDAAQFSSHVSLPPRAMVERELLWRQVVVGKDDALEIEVRAINLLAAVLSAAQRFTPRRIGRRLGSIDRQQVQVERVKAAVAADPARRWTLGMLASLAAASPFHLARIFKSQTAVSLYEYVLRMRLACALPLVLDSSDGLTDIALRNGFASHSHFTGKFRTRFGVTPSALRRRARKNVIEGILTPH